MKLSLNDKGVIHTLPLLLIIAVIGILGFLLISFTSPLNNGLFGKLFSKPTSKAATSDWGSETEMVQMGGAGYYGIGASGTNVKLVMTPNYDGTTEIIRSNDEGGSWGNVTNIGSGEPYLDDPMAVTGTGGSTVYLATITPTTTFTDACCSRDAGDIYVRRSTDGGQTFGSPVQVSTSQKAYRQSIAANGSNVYVVWMDYRSGWTWDIYYRKSTNGGQTWGTETKLVAGQELVGAGRPSIAVDGNTVHVAWMDGRDNNPPCYTMPHCSVSYYKRSTDGGTTWGPDVRLTPGTNYAGRPALAASNGIVMVVIDYAGDPVNEPNTNISYTMRSTDGGVTWGPLRRMTTSPGNEGHNEIAMDRNYVAIAWTDWRDPSSKEIYSMFSSDYGVTWGPEEQVSTGGGNGEVPLMAFTNNYLHIIWSDSRTGGIEMWYRKRALNSTPSSSPSPTATPTSSPTATPTATPTAGLGAPNVNTSGFCSNQTSGVLISWNDPGILFSQIATDQSFPTWYNKDLSATPTQSTFAPEGFTLRQTSPSQPLVFTQGANYYVRTWDGTNISPVTSFKIPTCATPTPTATPIPTLTATPTSVPSACQGADLDRSGKVDIFDYNILVGNFGKTGSGLAGDIDNNGNVNIFDYNILVGNFNKSGC